jgi:hypothetical protein
MEGVPFVCATQPSASKAVTLYRRLWKCGRLRRGGFVAHRADAVMAAKAGSYSIGVTYRAYIPYAYRTYIPCVHNIDISHIPCEHVLIPHPSIKE